MIKSFHLDESRFEVIRADSSADDDVDIVYKVPAWPKQPNQEWLGYIRFSGRNGGGEIEVVNRKATIEPWNLDLGGTTKESESDQAGKHGDGLKVALLVLLRKPQNLSVRCITGGFSWNFNFDKKHRLVVRLFRLTPAQINKEAEEATGNCRRGKVPFAASPSSDVKFVIGKTYNIRNGCDPVPVTSRKVTLQEFRNWTKAASFLQVIANDEIITTPCGDLMVDPALAGKIYLKGLLLKESRGPGSRGTSSASITGKPLKFGYNFASGNTNRDRQSVANAHEESQAISSIWHHVVTAARPGLIKALHEMLNCNEPEHADVSMAERTMSSDTIGCLKKYLFSGENEGKWYYSAKEKTEVSQLPTYSNTR